MKNKLITIVLSIMLFVIPLSIMPGGQTYNLPKLYVILISGAILFILMMVNYKQLKLDKKDYIILAFAVMILISTFLSSDLKISIIGARNRYEGMFTFYIYITIYFCAKKFLNYKNNKTLLVILQITYLVVSILGIAQHYIKLSTYELYPIFNRGSCGTFGNTNFMGSFISMGIPIFILTYIIKGNKISFITSLLVFWNLISCHARSGWVAFIVFSIALLIYLIKNKNKKYVIRSVILILCFLVIFAGIYFEEDSLVKAKINGIKKDMQILQNGDNITAQDLSTKVGSGRVQIWKVVLELIPKYPIFGVGTDNLKNGVIDNLTQTSIDFILNTKTTIDKAHNEYLHIAVTLGIPALIIYLIFLGQIIFPKIKEIFKKDETFIIASVIISYLVQAFFNISTIGVAPLFWFTLGILDNETINKKTIEKK